MTTEIAGFRRLTGTQKRALLNLAHTDRALPFFAGWSVGGLILNARTVDALVVRGLAKTEAQNVPGRRGILRTAGGMAQVVVITSAGREAANRIAEQCA
ncbi:MAG TPA: hypothetical protein VG248_17420 [Caulobacteraceae bacterium]|jgi:hypothetical protein|nr:hypothetical protein [Caulobacteraceae bacterium]